MICEKCVKKMAPYHVTEEEPNKVSRVYTLKTKNELIWFLEDLAQMKIHDSKKEAIRYLEENK